MALSANSSVRVILIEPEQPGNLGSVARAMANMGFSRLTLVNPKASAEHKMARAMAVASYPLLKKAHIVNTIEDALKDCHWSVGFTRRAGRQRREFLPMDQLSAESKKRQKAKQKLALVFGPESRGFTTHEAAACHRLVRIPTSREQGSINLAQAVMITLYELRRSDDGEIAPMESVPAPIKDLEGMYGHLEELLDRVHYQDRQNPERVPRVLRRLFNRAQPTKQEVRIIRGICRNALYWLKH